MDDILDDHYIYEFKTETINLNKFYRNNGPKFPVILAVFEQKVDKIEISKCIKCFIQRF